MTMQKDEQNLIGRILGKYEIRAEIGRGGMGTVYKGYDPLLDRYLAVKVLAPHLVWETEFVERFVREARAAARLKHANIVTIYDVGQQGNWYYFVMEYVEGMALDSFIRQHGLLPLCDVLDIIQALASALDYAHYNGLVHRDIKPGNIIVGTDGHITLTDFGIARAVDEKRLTSTGTILGTPEYMSPEQAVGAPADARSDLYSLGVVTYQLLCGAVPYQADSVLALLYKVINEPLPPIRKLQPALPKGIERVLQRVLAKAPAARYPNVTAFYEDLQMALSGAPAGVSLIRHGRPGAVAGGAVGAYRDTPVHSVAERRQAATVIESHTPTPRQATPTPRPATPPPFTPPRPPTPVTLPQRVAWYARIPVWVWAMVGVIALAGLVIGGGMASGMFSAAPTPTVTLAPTATHTPTSTIKPTNTTAPTPTATPTTPATATNAPLQPATDAPTRTPKPTATATATPGATKTPSATNTPATTPTPKPTTASPTPTADSRPPTSIPQPSAPSVFITFEDKGTWRRGDQAYGELSYTQEQVYAGAYAAKLSYNFPAVDDDFVVFSQSRNLAGSPNTFSAWVYGDGSGHFLNLWVQDAQNQMWAVHLGKVGAAGWRQMTGTLAPGRSWPDGHVSGPDNGVVDYPVRFYAVVLDRPGQGSRQGTLYIDDIAAWRSDAVAAPPATTAPASTAAPAPAGEIGRIVFTVQTGETYYLYSTDPNWSQMQEIGQTDKNNSTCAGSATASTLTGTTINLYGVNKCGITARTDVCNSPDNQYKVITNQIGDHTLTLSIYKADESQQWSYFEGQLNRTVGIQWTPNSQNVIFGVGNIINLIQAGADGYRQVTANVADTWPAQISPDGSMLYYLQAVGSVGAYDVFIVNLDGSGLRNLTNAPIAHKTCPRWRR